MAWSQKHALLYVGGTTTAITLRLDSERTCQIDNRQQQIMD